MAFSADWQIWSAVILRAVREVAATKRAAIIELERGARRGHIELQRGQVIGAGVGRLQEIEAFHHLLLWGEDATVRVRTVTDSSVRSIHLRVDPLIEAGLNYVNALDKLADWLGGPRTRFESVPARLSDKAVKLPAEVRRFAAQLPGEMALVDLIEDSSFRPIDTVKVCYRLRELGVLLTHEAAGGGPLDPGDITHREPRLEPAELSDPPPIPVLPSVKPATLKVASERGEPTGEVTRRRAKTGNSVRFTKASLDGVPQQEPPFDEVDEAFFARAEDRPGPEVDRFEDLENTATREKLSDKRYRV